MSDIRAAPSSSATHGKHHKGMVQTVQPTETKAAVPSTTATGTGTGIGGHQLTRPAYDPFAMRLGLGNWDNWGFLQPSPLDLPFNNLMEPFGGFNRTSALMNDMIRVPTMDLNENTTGYELQVDLPGVPKENVKVDLNGRTLTVSAERKQEHRDEHSYSRSYGTFSRSLVLPTNSDIERIDAKYDHGQLKVCVPKLTRHIEAPRNIRIA